MKGELSLDYQIEINDLDDFKKLVTKAIRKMIFVTTANRSLVESTCYVAL